MIELGLARIARLLKDTPIPWRAIHVAGTNGKGSVCAYASAMLTAGHIKCGRFTSPHLIDRWDCITINEETVSKNLFWEVEAVVKKRNRIERIEATEFELLTATAFEIFNREKVETAIVEVGLGGRHDATNILRYPSVTVITKIGGDHQSFLGSTLEDIAYHKAGIMKEGVRCFVDGSNLPSVIQVLRKNAEEIGAGPLVLIPQDAETFAQVWNILPKEDFMDHQRMNIHLAFEAVKKVFALSHKSTEPRHWAPAVQQAVWPGRLQTLDIGYLIGREQKILLDGAHNAQSAEILGSYVDQKLREKGCPVTWVVAVSKGKDINELLSCFLRPGDNIVAVTFDPVDGMPWICPEEADNILEAAQNLGFSRHVQKSIGDLPFALQLASRLASSGPLVVAGSLYLVSDVLRLLREQSTSDNPSFK